RKRRSAYRPTGQARSRSPGRSAEEATSNCRGLRFRIEQYVVSHRIVIFKQVLDKQFWINLQRAGPYTVAIRRHPATTRFKLGNESVIFCTHKSGQITLGKSAPFAQLA